MTPFTVQPPRRAAALAVALLAATLSLPAQGQSASAAVAASAASAATPTRSAAAPPAPHPIGPGAWLLPGRFERGRQPDGNSLLLEGDGGLVVIDSGRHAEHAQGIVDWARARGRPLQAVVNTHWHLDHLGGNAALRRFAPGLRAYGTAALQHAVSERMPVFEADLRRMLADPATTPEVARMVQVDLDLYAERAALRPDERIEPPPRDLVLAGRRLRVGVERGVSGGDLWVLDEASGVLAVGDFVTLPVPFLDTACPAQWQASMARLASLPFERVLPGHGPMMSRADFTRYAAALDRLLACAAGPGTAADCASAWLADLGPLLAPGSERSVQAMLAHYFESRLRARAEVRDRFCAG